MVKDMTRGNPTKLLLSFSIPLLIGNIFQQLYGMVDTIIVGRGIGVNALAAVGSTGSINFLILGFVIGLAQGFAIMVSHAFGANDYQKMRKIYTMSIYLSLLIGILISMLSVLGAYDLLRIMNTPNNIINQATHYIQIIFGGMIITIFFNLFSSILRALGDSKTPLYAMIAATVVNIVLDIVFVIGFKMGVEGAAWATLIAQLCAMLFCFFMIKKIDFIQPNKSDWVFHKQISFDLIKLGLPVACMNSVTASGVMILQLMVNGFGSTYVAAYSAASRIMMVIEQPGVTFGFAMAAYIGQNLGANRIDRIRDGIHKCIRLSLILYAFITLVLIVFGKDFISIIVSSSETKVISIAYEYIFITSLFLWVLSLLFIYRSSLQGMGDTFIPMISGIVELVCRILVALCIPTLLGFKGIAFAEAGAWIGAELLLMIAFYYKLNKKESNHVVGLPD
ncbi:MAG: MATE family efflux transporter [Erysipelotrichaceae bacterium]